MWTCPKCKSRWTNGKLRCTCGRKAPKRRPNVLRDLPREWWVERYGDRCMICGAEAKARALHRDHEHGTNTPRGILCWPCNRKLPEGVDADWLRKAAAYLDAARSAGV